MKDNDKMKLPNTIAKARKAYPHLNPNGWYIKEIVKEAKCKAPDIDAAKVYKSYMLWVSESKGVGFNEARRLIKAQHHEPNLDRHDAPQDAFSFYNVPVERVKSHKKSYFEQLQAKCKKYKMIITYETRTTPKGLVVASGWAA